MKRCLASPASWLLAIPVGFWGWHHERRILRTGRELTPEELADASAVGVVAPERLRVLPVERVPNPFDRVSGLVAKLTGYSIFNPAGMTLRYGVFTVDALEHDRGLLAHEFVHVAQYERFQMFGFMRRYIFQCLADGYLEAPMEIEARELSDRLLEA
ncbi:MAG: hypothetical protein ACI8XO_002281 [Verrucomicrobiales bacterium]|jgi:hypothetical protein